MKRFTMVLSLVFATVAALAVTHAPAQAGQWKWVDAGSDCVSTCNASEYNCPCYIFL